MVLDRCIDRQTDRHPNGWTLVSHQKLPPLDADVASLQDEHEQQQNLEQ